MRSPTLNTWPRKLKLKVAKSPVLPTNAPISGVRRSLVNAPTTVAKAAPMTTPTAISTTLPRRMNFLKPLSMEAPRIGVADTLRLGRGAVKDQPHGAIVGVPQQQRQSWPSVATGIGQIRMGITM